MQKPAPIKITPNGIKITVHIIIKPTIIKTSPIRAPKKPIIDYIPITHI